MENRFQPNIYIYIKRSDKTSLRTVLVLLYDATKQELGHRKVENDKDDEKVAHGHASCLNVKSYPKLLCRVALLFETGGCHLCRMKLKFFGMICA